MKTRLLAVLTLFCAIASAGDLSQLDVLHAGYPRAFFFRQSEGEASSGRMSYEQWEARFNGLSGIMGKVLEEEVPGRSKGLPYFVQFKKDHPNQAVLLHLNGDGRDPHDEGNRFFAGHWLYHNGAMVLSAVPAAEGETVLKVTDTSLFKVNAGRYGKDNEDLGLCALDQNGKPDWNIAEQVRLISIDEKAKTITVGRAAYGTSPVALEAGKAYVAAHVQNGPWGSQSHWIWCYNHATTCPKDAQGRTCSDIALELMGEWYGPGGPLEVFDGLEFDVSSWSVGEPNPARRAPDANCDGAADGGWVDGINVYGLGMLDFHRRVREILGPERVVMADDNGPSSQRSFGILNGIESEGFPHLADYAINRWSESLNRHLYWRDHAAQPVFNYINHKFKAGGETYDAPFNLTRLVLGTAVLTDSAITYSLAPPSGRGGEFGVWDELRMGAEHKLHWLGMPMGDTVRLGRQAPDLFEGAGAACAPEFLARWEAEDASIALEAPGVLRITPATGATEARIRLAGLDAPAGDLSVYFKIWGTPESAYPETVTRIARLTCAPGGQLVAPRIPKTLYCLRGGEEAALDASTGASIAYVSQFDILGQSHSAYRVHPPYKKPGGTGYVAWERTVTLPKGDCALSLFTGLSPSPGKSDGLTYSIEVVSRGKRTSIWSCAHAAIGWQPHHVDLARWAGQRVTLRFIADAGPKDNSVSDHGAWGEVRIATPGNESRPIANSSTGLTHVGPKPFLAGFYFRDAGPGSLDLTLDIEGAGSVYVSEFTMHSATDALAREFEHGVVLVNPAAHAYTFDLAALYPGAKFRRLQGTEQQDTETNNGQPVDETVTLGAKDGLFLVRVE